MSSARLLAAATTAVLLAIPAAHAADLRIPPPLAPPPEFSGWYLRGYVGMTNQQVDKNKTGYTPNPFPNDTITTQFFNFDSSPLAGGGIGYQVNDWLRFDGTVEYRSSAHFHGQQIDSAGGVTLPDDYNASKNELLFLANAYLDLGTWWCVTPFIGGGVGASRNTITGFVDQSATMSGTGGIPIIGTAYGDDHSKWSFAWAVYAGLAYQVTPGFAVDLTYRYVNLGKAQTGPVHAFDGTVIPTNPFVFDNITSNDFLLGVRWTCCEAPPPPPPLMRKG